MSMSTLLGTLLNYVNDGYTYSHIMTYVANIGTSISYTIAQLGHVVCV